MKMSECLRMQKDMDNFLVWLSEQLACDDPEAGIDSIDYVNDAYDGVRIELNWTTGSSCECCTYNYFGTTLKLGQIDDLYEKYLSQQ